MTTTGVIATFLWQIGLASPGASASLPNGGAATAAFVNLGTAGYAVVAQSFDAQGDAVGAPVTVLQSTALQTVQGLSVTALPGVGYAVSFAVGSPTPAREWQIVRSDNSLAFAQPVKLDASTTFPSILVALSGGQVAEFFTSLSGKITALMERPYQLSGTAGAAMAVSPDPSANVSTFSAARLANGQIILGVNAYTPAGKQELLSQSLSSVGLPIGSPSVLATAQNYPWLQAFTLSPGLGDRAIASWQSTPDKNLFNYETVTAHGPKPAIHSVQFGPVAGTLFGFMPRAALTDGSLLVDQIANGRAGFSGHATVLGTVGTQPKTMFVTSGRTFDAVALGGDRAQCTFNDTHGSLVTEVIQYAGKGLIPPPSLALTATQGATSDVFAAKLSQAASTPVALTYSTSDATAVAGVDYLATSGTITLQPGQTTASVSVKLLNPAGSSGTHFVFTVSGDMAPSTASPAPADVASLGYLP